MLSQLLEISTLKSGHIYFPEDPEYRIAKSLIDSFPEESPFIGHTEVYGESTSYFTLPLHQVSLVIGDKMEDGIIVQWTSDLEEAILAMNVEILARKDNDLDPTTSTSQLS